MAAMKSLMVVVVVMVVAVKVVVASPASLADSASHRDEKFLNLEFLPFLSLRVDPIPCNAKSDNSSGTCASAGDCRKNGGKADGSCFSGFGVCCVYQMKCGETIRANNSYLVNDDYPSTLMDIDNCQYTIQKVSENVCQLRLDFEKLELAGPDDTSTCSIDTFTFVGTAGANPTVICGDNTGQHMYLDMGSGNGAARINIATTSTNASRTWRIKVTQFPCDSASRAPPNCLQYYTDYSGTINSFNYQNEDGRHQLASQSYTVCIRTREGFCGIKYMAEHFSLTEDAANPQEKKGDNDCKEDFILVPRLDRDGKVTEPDRYCGSKLEDITSYSKPFELRFITNSEETSNEKNNRGFSIRYTQVPC
ncbi:uncharacterized protein LOC123514814 [Portunus trituberculatus]|nr:uncharacterized protein LOC123514814 [Portunus trituberculatus]